MRIFLRRSFFVEMFVQARERMFRGKLAIESNVQYLRKSLSIPPCFTLKHVHLRTVYPLFLGVVSIIFVF